MGGSSLGRTPRVRDGSRRTEYSKIARILKRSHVFQFIPLSCEIVQCSPCVFGRAGRLSAATLCCRPPPSPSPFALFFLPPSSLALTRLGEIPHRPREIAYASEATDLSTW